MRTEIQSSKIQPVDLNPNEDLLKSLLKLDRDQFNQVIKSYKLQYDKDNASLNELTSFQSYFNRKFEITDNPRDDDKDFRKFLNEKINKAFQNPEKIQEYFEAIDRVQDPKSEGRGIHGGNHVARVALYSKMLLNLYRKYKDHLPENLQKEIEEFDEQKEKDLEVLTLMHDCARTHGKHDQFEYKNAFYVALMMRRLGDPRFTGDSISDEGLDLITNLSLKESEEKDKSLMSKLIQSADSLAITRDSKIIFDHNYVNATHDFYQIENSEMKARALNEMNQLAHLISYHEFVNKHKKTKDETEILEFVGNPFEVFCKKITEEQFLQKFEQAREDSSLIIPQEAPSITPCQVVF